MIKETTVILENRPGRLKDLLKTLSDVGIDINGISIADSVDYGLCRLILSDPEKGRQVLSRHGFIIKEADVMAVEVADIPGGLQKAFEVLAGEGINIQYVYAFGTRLSSHAMIIVKASSVDKAEEALGKIGVKSLSTEELEVRLKA